jgi:restriction endonuclease S subunit
MSIQKISLKELCSFRHGGTLSKANPEFWGGDIPWVSPKDMKVPVITTTQDFITAEGVEGSATSVVPEGTILVVTRSGILAHSFPVAQAGRQLAFNQDIKAVQAVDKRITNDYVYWFLRGKEGEIVGRGVKKGATVHSLQSGFLENLLIPVSSLLEQQRVVDMLARAENIVRMRREAQRISDEIVQSLLAGVFGQ